MPQPLSSPKAFRFGPFAFDPKSGELRTEDRSLLLADQPLALLTALLERPGEMISREELRGRLWPDGTFVDFDHGLNSAVSRLREALNDSASTPRFVETIPRRGYRLLVPVETDGKTTVDLTALNEPHSIDPTPAALARAPATAWPRRRRALVWTAVIAAALFLVFAAGVLTPRRAAPPAPLLASVVIDLPNDWSVLNESPAISPDSRHIVFSAFYGRAGRRAVWDRPLDVSAARMLADTEDGSEPFWSPDAKSIGFFAKGKLKVLQLAGGPARVVCDAPPGASGTWITAGVILFAPGPTGAVSEVSVERGTVRDVTELDRSKGELRHVHPTALPDGRHFVYLANRKDQLIATLASVDRTSTAVLGPVQSHVEATRSGHVLFVRDGTLVAQWLDVAAGRLTGDATVLADRLTVPGRFYDGSFSTSPTLLVYLKTSDRPNLSELRIFDRSGKTAGTVGEPAAYTQPGLSPDGTRLAVASSEPGERARDIWVFDLAHNTRLRVTTDRGDDLAPKWSSDGKWLMFSSDRRGVRDIYKRLASGEGADELVFESAISKSINAWSADGRFVAYDTGGGFTGQVDLHVLPLVGNRRPSVRASQPGFQHMADISPDSRLIAYASSESGKYEVIVEDFPEEGGRRQISTNGGKQPAWRGDGRELFFLSDNSMMAVDVHPSAKGVKWSVPRALFKIPEAQLTPLGFTVSPDGERFILVSASSRAEPQKFTTVLNWTSLIK